MKNKIERFPLAQFFRLFGPEEAFFDGFLPDAFYVDPRSIVGDLNIHLATLVVGT